MSETINSLLFENGVIILCDAVKLIDYLLYISMCVIITYFCITWYLIILNKYTDYSSSKRHFCAQNTESLRFLIVGGKNSGKSSTLESLAGHERTGYFSTCPHLKYVRNDNAFGWNIFAVKCENVETDTIIEVDDIQTFSKCLKNTVMFLDNFHVIMYCLPFHKALSQESMEYIKVLKSVLGFTIFKRHVVFGFTYGDVFEDTKYEKGHNNFEDWLNRLEPSVLTDSLMACKMRCVLMNNKTDNVERKRVQADTFFSMCRQIVLDRACLKVKHANEKEANRQIHYYELPVTNLDISRVSSAPERSSELDLLLIGRTGNGKSSTGNTILRRNAFNCLPYSTTLTETIQSETSDVYCKLIKVVDGPGIGDMDMCDEVAIIQLINMLEQAILANPHGYHAFLLVVRFGGSFTKEDTQTIKLLKGIFGDYFVAEYCILVVTCGDNYDPEETGCDSFDDWCRKQSGVFAEMMEECKGRVLLFDNKTKDLDKLNEQHARLISMVEGLSGPLLRYKWTKKQLSNIQWKILNFDKRAPMVLKERFRTVKLGNRQMAHVQEMENQFEDIRIGFYQKHEIPARASDEGTGLVSSRISSRELDDVISCKARKLIKPTTVMDRPTQIIRSTNVDELIFTNNPFNTKYLVEEDVQQSMEESIILNDETLLSGKDYMEVKKDHTQHGGIIYHELHPSSVIITKSGGNDEVNEKKKYKSEKNLPDECGWYGPHPVTPS